MTNKVTDLKFDIDVNYKENLEKTSEIIYETHRRKKLEGKTRSKFLFFISCLFSLAALISIALLQYDEYFAFLNDRIEYINQTNSLCKKIEIANIDVVSTPIAGCLIIIYIIIYKRRVFLRKKFKYRNIGLPMIISCWNKSHRTMSAFTYGIIAFNVFNIVKNTLSGVSNSKTLIPFKDPSGLLPLLVKITEMFLIGIRYYPVLVAFRVNTFLINITCAIYMWVDYFENIFQFGKCESIYYELQKSDNSKEEAERIIWYFISYKMISAIPLAVFSAFIVITLTYKSCINIIDFKFRYSSPKTRSYLIEKSKDSCGCLLCNVEDEHEIIYSKHDLEYVFKIFSINNNNNDNDNDNKVNELDKNNDKKSNQLSEDIPQKYNYIKIKNPKKKSKLKELFSKHVYDWDPTFRFTSRFINSITVASVALYYLFLFWLYRATIYITKITFNKYDENISLQTNILCAISDILCVVAPALENNKTEKLSVTEIKNSVNSIVIVPIFGALLICLFQLFVFIKETKTFLKELYVGKCEFVKKASSIGNQSIASASFHFGGYLTGYLIWGYVIIYAVLVLIGIIILLIRFIGDHYFGKIALRLVPFITVFIVKKVVTVISTRFIFLNTKSNVLALDNFRAFNIFLYFNFYFDCFMGLFSALFRLIKAILIGVYMMPRLSYSFLGRHWERMDNAYACYSGFLHMEAMHTNPILITFISILYYKDLSEHIRRYKISKKYFTGEQEVLIKMRNFNGRLSSSFDENLNKKTFNKTLINKWHLYAFLSKHKDLIRFRKKYLKEKNKENDKSGIGAGLKFLYEKCCFCCRKKPIENF